MLKLAESSESVGKLLKDLREPRPGGNPCIPWLGEVEVKERVIQMCAAGQIAIDVRGLELLQARPGETYDDAWHRMKGKLGTGKHLDETILYTPDAVVASGGKTPQVTTTAEMEMEPRPPPAAPASVQMLERPLLGSTTDTPSDTGCRIFLAARAVLPRQGRNRCRRLLLPA